MAGAGFVAFRVGALVFKYVASAATSAGIRIGGAFSGARRALSIPWPFAQIKNGLQSIGRNAASAVRRVRQLGPAGMSVAAGAAGVRMLGGSFRLLGGGIKAVGRAFAVALGPVSLLMMGLSYGVDYVIENWDKVGPYFTALWGGVKNTFTAVLGWMQPMFDKIGGWIDTIGSGLGKVKSFVGNIWNSVTGKEKKEEKAQMAAEAAPKPAANAAPKPAGEEVQNSVSAAAPKPAGEAVQKQVSTSAPKPAANNSAPKPAGQAVPSKAEARENAARERAEQTEASPGQQPAKNEKSQKFEQVVAQAAQEEPKRQGKIGAGQSAPQIVQPQVQVSVNVTQNGVPDQTFATGVMNAIRARQSELESMISEIVNNQARLAYGG